MLAPMPSELQPLVKTLALRRTAGESMYEGDVGAVHVVATKTGMGTKNAAEAAERLLDANTVDHVMVVGIAGGVGPTVAVGDLILPEVVVDKDSGAEYRPAHMGDVTPRGKLVTHDDFDLTPAELERLVADGFIAVDMETAAIGAVCERRGVPWSAVRVISDIAGVTPGDVIDLANPDGSPNVVAGLKYMVRHPNRIPYLIKLARNSFAAARAAAAAAKRAVGGA
jgi:adenosylhomocysteine nucleosidase